MKQMRQQNQAAYKDVSMSDKTILVVDDDTAHATMLKTLMKGWGVWRTGCPGWG